MSTTSTMPESPFLTIAEVSTLLRISVRTAYGLAARGELPTVKVGGSYRVPRRDLVAWLNRTRRGG